MKLVEFKTALRQEFQKPLDANMQAARNDCLKGRPDHKLGNATHSDAISDVLELLNLPQMVLDLSEKLDDAHKELGGHGLVAEGLTEYKSAAVNCKNFSELMVAAHRLASTSELTHAEEAKLKELLVENKDNVRRFAISAFEAIDGMLLESGEDDKELDVESPQESARLEVGLQPPFQGKYLEFIEDYALDFSQKLEGLSRKLSRGPTPGVAGDEDE